MKYLARGESVCGSHMLSGLLLVDVLNFGLT